MSKMNSCICRHCGKIFLSETNRKCCRQCENDDDALFSRIEEYLKKYPNSNAMQIADGLGVSTMEIVSYIDEGRLWVNKGSFKKFGGL